MKIQNILRAQAMTIGFAGMLLLASAAPAQEITNTEWPDGPNVSAPAQAKPAANDLNVAVVNTGSVADTATVAQPVAIQDASVAPAAEGWMVAAVLAFFAMFALLLRAATRRGNRKEMRVRQVNSWVALS
jgi:hypothetical protein